MVLDTNIIIAYLGGEKPIIDFLNEMRREGRPLFLSTIVEAEVLAFSKFSNAELELVQNFLEENFTSIPFDRHLAQVTAGIRRTIRIKFPDAAIAAAALITHTPLITRNLKDFKHVPGLLVHSV